MATLRDQIVERLETRRMSIADYKATWCESCLRCSLSDPAVKGSFVLICGGSEDCRQQLQFGTISECISALRAAETV